MEFHSFTKQLLTAHEMSNGTSEKSETTRLNDDVFFLKERIRNKDKVIIFYCVSYLSVMIYCYKIDVRLSKQKTVAVQTTENESITAGTMTTRSLLTIKTATTQTIAEDTMQKGNKTTDRNL